MREGSLRGGVPYLAVGSGPPLVLLPGLSGENANPTGLARRFQLRWTRPLARHFTVYIVNRRPGLEPSSTMADLAGHCAEAVADRFASSVPVVGTSTGGSVAQQLAIDHPALVDRLVLSDTAYRLSDRGREAQRGLARLTEAGRPRQAWAAVGPAMGSTGPGRRAMTALLWLSGSMMNPDDPSDMLVTIAAEDAFDCWSDLPRISAPTLVVAGERDGFYSPELFGETAARIPHARLLLYPGKGHDTGLNHGPAVRSVIDFLTAEKSSTEG